MRRMTRRDDLPVIRWALLEQDGTVSIIAINTTITLMKADGTTINVVGPLTFSVQKALAGEQLYKFLNAP